MEKNILLKAMVLVSVLSLSNQSFAVVDSTTDNQLPSMREDWQNPSVRTCPYVGEMDLAADYKSNVTSKGTSDYKDEYSDIEEMESGGDPILGWVS